VNSNGLHIVVVDDHGVVRRGVRALLETQPGWQVVGEGATGREAVELVRNLRPQVVVLDLSMPEMNGLEATRQIVKESPQTEVLVLTMHHSEQLARDVLQAGARGYLLKSVAEGNSSKQVATALGVSVKTVEAHRANIMRKLRLRSVSDLVRYAIRNKIVQP
jgi:DNA-binding NarL/FixJ family response regulator